MLRRGRFRFRRSWRRSSPRCEFLPTPDDVRARPVRPSGARGYAAAVRGGERSCLPAVQCDNDTAIDRWGLIRTGICPATGMAHLSQVPPERGLRCAAADAELTPPGPPAP